jgi:murein DD-endopeptidase MepM/ murein hydrolase activator NlpD
MCEVSIAFIIISSSIISNLLAHLKPGSILVKVGDKVERGQWIA